MRVETNQPLLTSRSLLNIGQSSINLKTKSMLQTNLQRQLSVMEETLGKPKFADSKKLITDDEGNILEVSFSRMLFMMTELDGNALAIHRRTLFLNYKKFLLPIEMLFYLIDLYCNVPRGEDQQKSWRKVVSIFEYWIQQHFEDFQEEEMEEELFNFLEDTITPTIGIQTQKDLINLFEISHENLKQV